MVDSLTLASFAPHSGETFRVRYDPDHALEMELVEVRPLGGAGMNRREPFALTFKGPATPILPQQIYRIEHGAVGDHDLFIVPIGPGQGGLLYEAIFT